MTIYEHRSLHEDLIGQASELIEASARLEAGLAAPTAHSLASLVTGMNCYYSNLIEGHRTLPLDIDRALKEIRAPSGGRDLKSLALAHIRAEAWAREQTDALLDLGAFAAGIHFRFCSNLPESMLELEDGSRMTPGRFREQDVSVGRHVAPQASAMPAFLDRFSNFYGLRLETASKSGFHRLNAIVSSMAAHHRFAWIHPFPDGNGRVARILLDAMLRKSGINGAALWSMSRGLAKSDAAYKACLAAADEPRMGDLDGRGNLSERKLAEFCSYALETAIDQALFMGRMFSLETMSDRIAGYFQRVRFDLKPQSEHLYLHAFRLGEFERMEAGRLTGMPERTARNVLSQMLSEGLLTSESPKGKIRAGFPVHALGSLLPNLYPAGDVDVAHRGRPPGGGLKL